MYHAGNDWFGRPDRGLKEDHLQMGISDRWKPMQILMRQRWYRISNSTQTITYGVAAHRFSATAPDASLPLQQPA